MRYSVSEVKVGDYHTQALAMEAEVLTQSPNRLKTVAEIFGFSMLATRLNGRNIAELPKGEATEELRSMLLEDNPLRVHTPNYLNTQAHNYRRSDLRSAAHLTSSLNDSMHDKGGDNERLKSRLAKQKTAYHVFAQAMTEEQGETIHSSLEKEISANRVELDSLTQLLLQEQAAHGDQYSEVVITPDLLMSYQAKLFRTITSNHTMITPDFNYRFKTDLNEKKFEPFMAPFLNGDPEGRHRTLRPVALVPPTNRIEIGQMRSDFGFVRVYHKDGNGIVYLKERPYVSIANELQYNMPELGQALGEFEGGFPFIHDTLHHVVPVYSKNFILAPEGAPIAPYGRSTYREAYDEFGKNSRGFGHEYEEGLAIIHKDNWQNIFARQPELLQEKLALAEAVVKQVDHELKTNTNELTQSAAHYSMATLVDRLLTIFPANSNELRPIRSQIDQLDMPSVGVTAEEINTLLKRLGIKGIEGVASTDYSSPGVIPGSEHIVRALEELGLLTGQDVDLSGFNRFRWETITHPSTDDAIGFQEKIHGRKTIYYGTPESYEEIRPTELILKQLQAFQADINVYQGRVLEENLARIIRDGLHQFIDPERTEGNPANLLNNLSAGEMVPRFVELLDRVSHSCMMRSFEVMDEESRELIAEFAEGPQEFVGKDQILRFLSMYQELSVHMQNKYGEVINNIDMS